MNHLVFGNYFIFYLAGITGIIMSVAFSIVFQKNKLIYDYIGFNTLYLLGFIGIFYQFATGLIAYLYVTYFIENSYVSIYVIVFFSHSYSYYFLYF